MFKKVFKKGNKRITKLEYEVEQANIENKEIKDRNNKIDQLSQELKDHLKENNFGRRYFQMWINGS